MRRWSRWPDNCCRKIAALAGARTRKERRRDRKESAQVRRRPEQVRGGSEGAAIEVVVIGVSTGGPSALEEMLPRLPADFPVPMLIVQHMPKLFTGALAERLDRCCALRVREAYDGAALLPGTIWLAPGDATWRWRRGGGRGRGRRGVQRYCCTSRSR